MQSKKYIKQGLTTATTTNQCHGCCHHHLTQSQAEKGRSEAPNQKAIQHESKETAGEAITTDTTVVKVAVSKVGRIASLKDAGAAHLLSFGCTLEYSDLFKSFHLLACCFFVAVGDQEGSRMVRFFRLRQGSDFDFYRWNV